MFVGRVECVGVHEREYGPPESNDKTLKKMSKERPKSRLAKKK